MKVCLIQPLFSRDAAKADECFDWIINALDQCDSSMDIIVLPESSDVPFMTHGKTEFMAAVQKNSARLLQKSSEIAKRCHAIVFANATCPVGDGWRNRTVAFDRLGNIVGHYDKQHLVPMEENVRELDASYTYEPTAPYILELEGIRFGFLTCYDFYFYEMYSAVARLNPDIIIGCSQQRSDTHRALEIFTANLAYNTNSYVLRSSVSMGEDSPLGGAAMVVAPDGNVLLNMQSRVGMGIVDFDPHRHYRKPGGFGNPDCMHHEYTEKGRRPWKYRPAGSAIIPNDDKLPYPRVCAHRGFSAIAPENSMPAFGAAVALGAEEIEFDVWYTKDGEIVSMHDSTLDRVSNGTGKVWDYTYEELLSLDFGAKHGDSLKGLHILTLEEILRKFSCHTIMNIHVKTVDEVGGIRNQPYNEKVLEKMIRLLRQYDCEKHCYCMTVNDTLHAQLREAAPDIARCMGIAADPWDVVNAAIRNQCKKVQLFKPYFNQDMFDKARANGILVNVFWSDEPEEAKHFLDMGADTILSNDYWKVAQARNEWLKEHRK